MCQENHPPDTLLFCVSDFLALGNGLYRADTRAGAAVDAGVGIDLVLRVSLGDRLYRALRQAGSAIDAGITDYIRHVRFLLSLKQFLHRRSPDLPQPIIVCFFPKIKGF